MCVISQELKDKIWEKGTIVEGFDSNKVRKDACGAWIQYDMYGDRGSIFGWDIDHIFPKTILREKNALEEEIDNIDNLRPLNWINNESKNLDYPVYHAKVISKDDKNIRGDFEFEIDENTQSVIANLFGKYLR